jgi:START domain.
MKRKTLYLKFTFFLVFIILCMKTSAQPVWKLVKEKNGMKIFTANAGNSKFKNIRVQMLSQGTIQKLTSIISDINKYPEWVYKEKTAVVLKQVSNNEFIYYIESVLPWPVSNRDAIIHLTIIPDPIHHVLRMNAVSEPTFIEKKDGIVRIPFSKETWYVTEAGNKLNIDYTFQMDSGGSLPAWLVNMLADKGPYETFQNLKMKLLQ